MGKVFVQAESDLHQATAELIELQFPDLHKVGLTLDILMASNEDGDAVSHNGYKALAMVKITNLEGRARGLKDAVIIIDAEAFEEMTLRQREALLHHELTHLIPVRDDKMGGFKFDDLSRPKLQIKKHDVQFGWFLATAEIYGKDSPEVFQAQRIFDQHGQSLLLLGDGDDSLRPAPKEKATPRRKGNNASA